MPDDAQKKKKKPVKPKPKPLPRVLKKGVYQYRFLDNIIDFKNEDQLKLYTPAMRRRRDSSESSQCVDNFITGRGGPLLRVKKKKKTRLERKIIESYDRYDLCFYETYRRVNRFSQYDDVMLLKDKDDEKMYMIQDHIYDHLRKIRRQMRPFDLVPRRKKGRPKN